MSAAHVQRGHGPINFNDKVMTTCMVMIVCIVMVDIAVALLACSFICDQINHHLDNNYCLLGSTVLLFTQ